MKIDVTKMTDAELRKVAKKMRKAPCIVCEQPSTGYRKLHMGKEVAFLPICEQCKNTPVNMLKAAMEFASHGKPESNNEVLGHTYRGC